MDVRSYKGAEGDTDHQLVTTKVRKSYASRKKKAKDENNLKSKLRLDNPSVKAEYQLEISNRVKILADSSSNKG